MTVDDNRDRLLRFVADLLGPECEVTDRSRGFGRQSITWQLRARDGNGYYLKQHESEGLFHGEHLAYTEWIPRLPASDEWCFPELVAVSRELGALLLTEVEGDVLQDSNASLEDKLEMHRIAGALASQIHRLDVDSDASGKRRLYERTLFEEYIELAQPYVDAEVLAWASDFTARDDIFDSLALVPTHSDFSPRNWVLSRSGGRLRLGLIDWERARTGYWLQDAQRMVHDHWLAEPRLRTAFFEGYGRFPSEEEEVQLRVICLANALGTISWAEERGDTEFAAFGHRALATVRKELA